MKIIRSIEEWKSLRADMPDTADPPTGSGSRTSHAGQASSYSLPEGSGGESVLDGQTVSGSPPKESEGSAVRGSLGFVPTMGAIHRGHISLVERSVRENDKTVVSIFVNPTQFNDPSDLENYPRTFEDDCRKLEEAGADFVFSPEYRSLYPDDYSYIISENRLSGAACGRTRPGHFDGVLTVVMKLLQIIGAGRAYFGEKDWQQFQLVKGMAGAFFLPTEIVPCPIVREDDGLAMSSRNLLLSGAHRELAPAFHRILAEGAGAGDPEEEIGRRLREAGFRVDYVERFAGRLLAAVFLGDVRLIDNAELPAGESPADSTKDAGAVQDENATGEQAGGEQVDQVSSREVQDAGATADTAPGSPVPAPDSPSGNSSDSQSTGERK